MFICGKGGTGKTFYAKKLLKSLGYDFCISSSSNDPFQDYMGQNAIILDDLRDKSFEFEDLLKILDNNTASSVKSRFANKVFNGKMIIITSSIPLKYWFKSGRFNGLNKEDFRQLYRRINCYVQVTFDEISVFNGCDDEGNAKGLGRVFANELKFVEKEEKQKTNFVEMFENICEEVSLPMVQQQSFLKVK